MRDRERAMQSDPNFNAAAFEFPMRDREKMQSSLIALQAEV